MRPQPALTPASAKVAMPEWQATAPAAPPAPAPHPILRPAAGPATAAALCPSCCQQPAMRALGAADAPRRNGPARPARPGASTAAAAQAMKPSRITGTRCIRAARHGPGHRRNLAPAKAAQHLPADRPARPRGAASPAATAASFRARPASSTPVPRPAQPVPPNSAAAMRRRDGGVADAHLARDEQIGLGIDRLPSPCAARPPPRPRSSRGLR